MTDDHPPTAGPDPETITRFITQRYTDVDVIHAYDATFFSLDPDTHWPNFATIVTTDEHDEGAPSQLSRPGIFRLNLGVSGETFDRLVGGLADPDLATLDRLLPHPVYARQHWVSILNPSDATFETVVIPLVDEAHARVASRRARQAGG